MWPFRATAQGETSNASSTASEASEAAPPTARQARHVHRDKIRSISEDNLQPPTDPRGLQHPRRASPQARLRAIADRRSSSPSPNATATPTIHFLVSGAASAATQPPVNMTTTVDDDYIQRIVKMAIERDREERDRQSSIATQAAVAAALANQTAQVQALRKPDLPPFDKDNVETWIKRIENAYIRCNVVNSKNKFAFIERLFLTKDDKRVNRFLWGTQTDDEWTLFLSYLRERYGRTKKQEVAALLNGVPRDGRRPSELASHILELTENITIDDVRKEVLLKQMPKELVLHIGSKVKDLSLQATADVCDEYFDQNGKILDAATPSTVHHVSALKQPQPQQQPRSTTSFTADFESEAPEAEVNAVRFQNGQRRDFNVSNGPSSRGRSSSNNHGSSNSRSTSTHRSGGASSSNAGASGGNNNNNPRNKKVCHYHSKWGEQAENCEGSWCILKHKIAPKGQASR